MNYMMTGRIKQVFIILLLLFTALAAGCGPAGLMDQPPAGQTRTVQDSTGTVVHVPIHPVRIVSVGVSTNDMLIPLTGTDRIAAISNLPSNWTTEASKIKGRVTNTTESVMAYQPDLIVVPDWNSESFIGEMRSMNLPVYVYKTPTSLDETKQLIKQLAEVVNEKARGDEIVAAINSRTDRVNKFLKTIPPDKRKTVLYYTAVGVTGGRGTTFDSMSQYAGLINGADEADLNNGQALSREVMLKVNPDIMFIPSSAYDKGKYHSPEAASLYSDPALQGIKAIHNRQVFVIDARWIMSYSQFMVDGVEQMAADAYGYKKNSEQW